MKKFLMLLVLLFIFLAGCNTDKQPDEDDPVINYVTVQDIIDSIDILYSELGSLEFGDEDVQAEIARIRTTYDTLNDAEKEMITNYEHLLEVEEAYEAYKKAEEEKAQERMKLEKAVAEAKALAEEAIPTKTMGDDLVLPTSYVSEDGINVYIGWQSDSPETISSTGLVTQPRNSTKRVSLTAVCRSGDVKETVKKSIAVGPISYEQLPDKPVFAYYYSNTTALTEVERKTIDVINLSFGTITLDTGEVSVMGLNYSTVLQERKYGIRVLFSVQYKEGFQKWTSTAQNREKLAQSFLDICEKYHFDGVDIDWEYPVGTEVSNYVEFMKVLYDKFKAKSRNYLVTSAMYGGPGAPKYNAGESCKYMDYVHLMTYDLNAPEKSTHLTALRSNPGASNTSVESTVAHYIANGVPKEKIVIGAAFYGKRYDLSVNGSGFIYQDPIRSAYTVTYSKIKNEYLSKLNSNDSSFKFTREWDSKAQAPYLCLIYYNSDGSVKERAFVTYDDAESVKLKMEYVLDEGLGGLMFWQLGEEDRSSNDLVGAIYDALNK